MTRYNLWRYFGFLPEVPELAFTEDPDQALSLLKTESARISVLFAAAMRFSRLDFLKENLKKNDWEDSPEGLLNRSRLRFYRAIIENPDSPEPGLLDKAAVDFRRAADHSSTSSEALAGLVRIHALTDGWEAALKCLRRLERTGSRLNHRAAAGACLFLSGLPGTGNRMRRKYLNRARRHLGRSGRDEEILLIMHLVEQRLGSVEKARKGWAGMAEKGSLEARYFLIQDDVDRWVENSQNSEELLLGNISDYKRMRPSDPRAFLAEGDLLVSKDPEAARMAWRTALVLDDRYADAWRRLGDLYKDAWDRGGGDLQGTWLEAAADAYTKALTLNPLNPLNRLALGITERESGHPAMAIGTLLGGLALSPDDTVIRRWIAMSWNDLAASDELTSSARTSAAERARSEWDRLLENKGSQPYDTIGLLRSMALEASVEPEKLKGFKPRVTELTSEILHHFLLNNSVQLEDLISLAEDFIRGGFEESAADLLDSIPENPVCLPGLKAAWGSLSEKNNSLESMKLYLEASAAVDSGTAEYINWMLNASDMAAVSGRSDDEESILSSALIQQPGHPLLMKKLTEKLAVEERIPEALELYMNALSGNPENLELLEDAVWFFRAVKQPDMSETLLQKAIGKTPRDGRLWNQLGVHFMEIAWDDDSDTMRTDFIDEAVRAYRKAVSFLPENPIFLGNLGDALRQSGKWMEAGEKLEKAVECGSDSGEDSFALNSLARLEDERSYAAEGSDSSAVDWIKSGEHYHQAAENSNLNSDFQRDYAWWLYRERRLEDAIDYYCRGELLNPSDDSLPYGVSICFLELGDEKAALEALERALKIKPSDPGMLADKADLLGISGKVEDAERIYRDVILKSGEESWIWERLAEFREICAEENESPIEAPLLYLDSHKHFDADSLVSGNRSPEGDKWRRLALKAWGEALKGEPENRKFKARYGAAWMALGFRDKARKLLTQETVNADSLNRLGRLELLESLNKDNKELWNLSKSHLSAAVETLPLVASYHADLGYWYYLSNQWGKALEAFRQAVDRAPGNPEYAANSGICAYASGNFEESVVYLKRALALKGSHAECLNVLGLGLMAAGSPNQALEAFRSACLADPLSEVFPANLAMAHESLHSPAGPLQ